MKTLYLPVQLRIELKKPFGIAIFGKKKEILKRFKKIVREKKFKKIITVGDYCSHKLPSDVKIFDGKVERKNIENILPFSLKCSNPAGTIQKDAWPIIKKAIKNNENVFVEGEEDLLAIPAILLSANKSVIVYGLPKFGVCLVEANPENRKKFKELLKKFR